MEKGKLENRIAIVSGGSSGIGRGIALEFAEEGAKVVVADIREEPKRGRYYERDAVAPTLSEVELGSEGLFVEADMADEEAIAGLVETAVTRFGGLDILVNNAGIHIPGNSQEISLADWDRVIGVNLRGVFVAIKEAVPHLKRSIFGRIINIASIQAFAGSGNRPPYASSKADLVNLSRDIALEVAADNVTVNTICPGFIQTAAQDYQTEEQIENFRMCTALTRFGTPRDIGRAAVFLAFEDASWITGVALTVDGGWMASL